VECRGTGRKDPVWIGEVIGSGNGQGSRRTCAQSKRAFSKADHMTAAAYHRRPGDRPALTGKGAGAAAAGAATSSNATRTLNTIMAFDAFWPPLG